MESFKLREGEFISQSMSHFYKKARTLIAFSTRLTFYNFDLDIYKKAVIVMCIESAVAVKLAPARRVEDDPERVVQE